MHAFCGIEFDVSKDLNKINLFCVKILSFLLQKLLYLTGRVTSKARLLQGRPVLEDDRKLCEYSLPEGATISALFKPDVDVEIKIKVGPKVWRIKVCNATSIMAVKFRICSGIKCGIPPERLEVRLGDTILEDALPLHFYSITEGSVLMLLKPYVGVRIENNHGTVVYWRINRKETIREVKAKLVTIKSSDASSKRVFSFSQQGTKFNGQVAGGHPDVDGMDVDGMRFYLVVDGKFDELDDSETVQNCKMKDDDRLYWLIYRWTEECKVEVLKTGRRLCGVEETDTCLGIKVKLQDQLGIPVHTLKLFQRERVRGSWFGETIKATVKDYYPKNEIADDEKPANKTGTLIVITQEELKAEGARRQEEERKSQLEKQHQKRSSRAERSKKTKPVLQGNRGQRYTCSVYDSHHKKEILRMIHINHSKRGNERKTRRAVNVFNIDSPISIFVLSMFPF